MSGKNPVLLLFGAFYPGWVLFLFLSAMMEVQISCLSCYKFTSQIQLFPFYLFIFTYLPFFLFFVWLVCFSSYGVVGRGVLSLLKFSLHVPSCHFCGSCLWSSHLLSAFPIAQAEVQASWVFPPAVVSLSPMFDPALIECSCCALQIAIFSMEWKGFTAACLYRL